MMGMKREAVQEERQRGKDKNENEVESTSSNGFNHNNNDMPIERILDSELRVDSHNQINSDHDPSGFNGLKSPEIDCQLNSPNISPSLTHDPVSNICQAADRQLYQLVEWAKHIPHFTELPVYDQVVLLKAGWNELLIAGFSHRSMDVKDGIVLANGLVVHRNSAHSAGVVAIFDRVLSELVAKMREMRMDKTELGCLRAIVLYNPGKFLKRQNKPHILIFYYPLKQRPKD